ncbi:MAG: YqhA family protein [Actinobacteria bacterium]|nr:YqhA family protein [Actinomycetota bacterium]
MKRVIGLTRYAVFVPALASIIGAILLMAQGSLEIVKVVYSAISSEYGLKETIVEVLTAVDAILLGTVLLVIGYGLYELFIDAEIEVPLWLRVRDLDDLKSKLIGVVVAILAVVFVGLAIFAFATKKSEKD